MASTMCWQPSMPIAPPIRVASVANAIAGVPSTSPRAHSTPESSRGASRRSVPAVEQGAQPQLGVAVVDGRRLGVATEVVVTAFSKVGCSGHARVKISATLWPPKPNELFSAAGMSSVAGLVGGHVQVEARRPGRPG